MKRASKAIALLCAVLVAAASLPSALAYFTTYTRAQGGAVLHLGGSTHITEEFSNWTKRVVITNEAGSQPVYVRARAFSGSQYPLTYSDEGGSWSAGDDGYYYYNQILNGGASTPELLIHIDGVPEKVAEELQFQVVVVYETTPVRYHENGEPYADWAQALKTGEGGGEQ